MNLQCYGGILRLINVSHLHDRTRSPKKCILTRLVPKVNTSISAVMIPSGQHPWRSMDAGMIWIITFKEIILNLIINGVTTIF